MVEFFTKYEWANPVKKYTAYNISIALFTFLCTFGVFDELWSNPRSYLMSEVVKKLSENGWGYGGLFR